jgi:hypothetical protein
MSAFRRPLINQTLGIDPEHPPFLNARRATGRTCSDNRRSVARTDVDTGIGLGCRIDRALVVHVNLILSVFKDVCRRTPTHQQFRRGVTDPRLHRIDRGDSVNAARQQQERQNVPFHESGSRALNIRQACTDAGHLSNITHRRRISC